MAHQLWGLQVGMLTVLTGYKPDLGRGFTRVMRVQARRARVMRVVRRICERVIGSNL